MKSVVVMSLLMILSSVSMAKENTGADAQAIDSACTADAATAGCGSEKVGTGLLKCMHAYKKAHADFKFSDGCKDAMKKMHHDKKAEK
jgi:hypothetical protein